MAISELFSRLILCEYYLKIVCSLRYLFGHLVVLSVFMATVLKFPGRSALETELVVFRTPSDTMNV